MMIGRTSAVSINSVSSMPQQMHKCGDFEVLEIKPSRSRPPHRGSLQYINKEVRLGEVNAVNVDLQVELSWGRFTKVTLREIPQFLTNAFNIISRKGKCTEGIFRKEGNSARINSINTYALFLGQQKIPPDFSEHIHDVCTLVKRFLRELKKPLIDSPAVMRNLIELAKKKMPISQFEFSSAFEVQFTDRKRKAEPMSLPHIGTLGFFMRQLYKLSLHSMYNQMTIENMATVFAPAIFNDDVSREKKRRDNRKEKKGSAEDLLIMKMDEVTQRIPVIKMLIEHANWIGVPSRPYVTSQCTSTETEASLKEENNSAADKTMANLEMIKCRSSSCIPRLRSPGSGISTNCTDNSSSMQPKLSLIDNLFYRDKENRPNLALSKADKLTPKQSRQDKAFETIPYSTPGSAFVGKTRVIHVQTPDEASVNRCSSPVLSSRDSRSNQCASTSQSATVSLPTPIASFQVVSTQRTDQFIEPRPRPRHRLPALPTSTSGSLIPQRVHSPALLPPPPTSNGEVVFRKPALPSSVHSAGFSASSSHFVKPAIPRPGRMQSRLPRPQDQLDGEFANSRVNMEALKKGTFLTLDANQSSRPSLAMVSTLGLVQSGVKAFSAREKQIKQEQQEREGHFPSPSSTVTSLPRFASSSINRPHIRK
ncbi:hypothetical protein WR25_02628 [Diploscapter pachys]|uniref:Rho-GAP domain-containing protein n=1 Tax=Diploscapter pachys TaxID=2018661 RepID=A0A2A2KEQ8_9BILA|nr:hypothetical protein WR25_02628 [Diploscapter pachys]